MLTDCPMLIGKLKNWSFQVDGVPHHIVYWLSPDAKPFDETKLVVSIQKIVQQTSMLFGRLPYREYTFLLQDNAYGSLEHSNSVTVGIPSSQLENYFTDYLGEIAHEYFHTWNLVRIHPVEYGDVSYKKSPLSKGLWFSEGLTMFCADLLLRRAGLPTEDSSRVQHLERLIRRYYNNPGNSKFSPEKVSMAEYGPQGMLGDYMASSHLQGELLGTMIDLIIRDATNRKYSIDDVMRKMMERFSGAKGFTGRDIEQIAAATSGHNMHQFFLDHIYGNKPIDFNKYLKLAGMRSSTTWTNASDSSGKPVADLRVYSFQSPGETAVKLWITNPSGCWGKAGLHTGDIILTVNKTVMKSENDFRQIIRRSKIGDIVFIEVRRPTGTLQKKVTVSGYMQPVVRIEQINETTEQQRRLRAEWLNQR
jgi:predicted metalloprotease with PDZ domain